MILSRTSARRRIGGAAALLLAAGVSATPAAAVNGDYWADILATRSDGSLWTYYNTSSYAVPFTSGSVIGSGWQSFTQLTSGYLNNDGYVDIVGIRSDGTLWAYYNSAGGSLPYSSGVRIGTGWQTFTKIAIGQINDDDFGDVVAVRNDGTLWVYFNSGSYSSPYSTGQQIGNGWGTFTRFTVGKVGGDRYDDILAVRNDGTLWVYYHGGYASSPYSTGQQVGNGWQPFTSFTLKDVDGDSYADILAVRNDGTLWAYDNNGTITAPYGSGRVVGNGWESFLTIF